MFSLLRDTFDVWRLQTRYRKLVQERLLGLAESQGEVEDADHAQWKPASSIGLSGDVTHTDPSAVRRQARELVERHPHAQNLLRLLEIYVAGPGLKLTHRARPEATTGLDKTCDQLWRQFVQHNARHWSFGEHARRAWRDGECFVRKFSAQTPAPRSLVSDFGADLLSEPSEMSPPSWPPTVRFIDPGCIAPTDEHPHSCGIVTAEGDVETPIAYLRHTHIADSSKTYVEEVSAAEVIHTRYGVDTNEPRGRSVFAPVLSTLDAYDKWLHTELQARRLQASIVLWRKVHGGGGAEGAVGGDGVKREKYRPGTIVTTSPGTELEFLQPNSNFGDAVELGRQLLLSIAAGVGVPEYMLTADASNGNFASTMIAEGPAVKLFQALQQWLAGELTRIWEWVMADAVESGLLPAEALQQVRPEWSFPTLVARDRPAERNADVALLDAGVLSRAEVARRDNVDPEVMQTEREDERASDDEHAVNPVSVS